jgi:hypothetical protein
VLDSRPLGGAWVFDRLWERLRIGASIITIGGRRRSGGPLTGFGPWSVLL